MKIINALPVGTVIKLKEAEKRVVIIGIMQQANINDKVELFDYVGVPYPEGFFGTESTILFQEEDIEIVQSLGFSDIERQQLISNIAELMEQLKNDENTEEN